MKDEIKIRFPEMIPLALMLALFVSVAISFNGCGGGDTSNTYITEHERNDGDTSSSSSSSVAPVLPVLPVEKEERLDYVVCGNNAICLLVSGNDNDITINNNSNNDFDYVFDLYYQYNNGESSCCVTCGECEDENVTVMGFEENQTIEPCITDISNGDFCYGESPW